MANSDEKIKSVLSGMEKSVGVEVTERARALLADREAVKRIVAGLSAEDIAAINAVISGGKGEISADTAARIKKIVGEKRG